MAVFQAKDRHYSDTSWVPESYMTALEYMNLMKIHPLDKKLLTGDRYDEKNKEIIRCSPNRTKLIPGILVVSGNSYGRKKNKLYYKCIPNDKTLPVFLVPYLDKTASFSKNKVDKFVLFVFNNWESKHPYGILQQTIGDVNNMSAFEEHQMNCKNINHSIQKFSKYAFKAVKQKTALFNDIVSNISSTYDIIDRTHENAISVDPIGCTDIDDAFNIRFDKESPWKTILSVYIANVPLWFDYLDLWNHLDRRVSTVYLTADRRGMLPSILSENLCSLKQGQRRFAIAMDVVIMGSKIHEVNFNNVLIKVEKNYAYDDEELQSNTNYKEASIIARRLNKQYNFIEEVENSHDVIQLFMVIMNNYVGKKLRDNIGRGIYRSFKAAPVEEKMNIPSEMKSFARTWKSNGGIYTTDSGSGHDMMNNAIDVYAHSTSPIRRLVDLINMTLLTCSIGKISERGNIFANTWIEKIDYINSQMKSTRRVQSDVKLLDTCLKIEDLLEKSFRGYIIDIEDKSDDMYRYTVMLNELSCISSFKTKDIYDMYESGNYSLHIFNDEHNLKQKIRIFHL